MWLSGALTRVYKPGIKFDLVPVLQGVQGLGKSTIAKRLGNKWFNDSLSGLGRSKDDAIALQGSWIVELAELSAMRTTDLEKTKQFITTANDSYREPYETQNTDHPRKSVFIATTNADDVLKDFTGNRRFMAIMCKEAPIKPLSDLDTETVKQIWAEVKTWYDNGNIQLTLSQAAQILQEEANEQITDVDELSQLVQEYINMPVPSNWYLYSDLQKANVFHEYRNFINDPTQSPLLSEEGKNNIVFAMNLAESDINVTSRLINQPIYMDSVTAAEIKYIAEGTTDTRGNYGKKISKILSGMRGWNQQRHSPHNYHSQRRCYVNAERLRAGNQYFAKDVKAKLMFGVDSY